MPSVEEIVKEVMSEFSCRASPEMVVEHDRLLAILPDKMESLVIAVDKLTEKMGSIETLIARDEARAQDIHRIDENTVEIFDRLSKAENQISGITAYRKAILWTIALVVPVVMVVLEKVAEILWKRI